MPFGFVLSVSARRSPLKSTYFKALLLSLVALLCLGIVVYAQTSSSLVLTPSSVVGGTSSSAKITLSSAAPAGGKVVTLSSSNTAAATVPATVTVASGSTNATFTVSTLPITSSATSTISAVSGGVTKTAVLSVAALVPSNLTLNPTSAVGGTTSTATVTLTGNAPTGGTLVALASNSAAATVPANVLVAAGSSTAPFTVTAVPVATTTTATISATVGSTTKTAPLSVTAPVPTTLTLNPTSVIGSNPSTGTVTLTGKAPTGGLAVVLSSNNAAATVPATVTVAANATTATFTVSTTGVATSTSATISAAYGGTSKPAMLTITPLVTALTLNPTSVLGGVSSTGTVTLATAAPTGGRVVNLSSNSASATVPGSVTVSAGATSATFTATTVPVAASTSATITASSSGSGQSAALTITPPVLSNVTVSPSSVISGNTATGTLTLTGNAPSGGSVVTLGSNNAAATVAASATVPAASNTVTFPINTTTVATSTSVTISATLNGTTKTAPLTVNPPIAGAPSGLSATPGNAKVILNWTAASGSVSSYKIYRRIAAGGYPADSSPTATVTAPATTYTDTGRTNGTQYFYVVKAYNASGYSPASNEVNATPLAPPAAPTNLYASSANLQITLNWSSSTRAIGYTVKRSTTSGSGYSTVGTTTGNASTSYVDTVPAYGQTYYYVVSATNGYSDGESLNSSQASVTPIAPLASPANLVVSGVYSQRVDLSWGAIPGATYYEIFRRTAATAYARINTSYSTTFQDVYMTNDTTYYYVIRVFVQNGNTTSESGNSNEVSASPLSTMPPGPAILSGSPGNASAILSVSGFTGATSYNVKRGTTSGTYTYTVNVPASSFNSSYTDTGLTNGVTYYYVVSSVNANGEGPNSNEIQVTPLSTPHAPWLTASPGNAQVSLAWNADIPALHVDHYDIYRMTGAGPSYYYLYSVSAPTTSYNDTSVTNGTPYIYFVSAVNSSGSTPSNQVTATPNFPPAIPTNLTATSGAANVTLSWTAANYTTGYNVKRGLQSGGPYATIASNVAGTTYVDNAASLGTAYYYVLTGVNTVGESGISNEAVATTMPEAPKFADVGSSRVTVYLSQLPRSATSFTLQRAVAGPAATPQPPTSGLLAWLRADALLGKSNNTPVNFWGDASATRSNAVQTDVTRQPLYLSNGLNGRPTIHFDGQKDFLQFPELSNIQSGFLVVRHRTGTQDAAGVLGDGVSNDFRGGNGTLLFQTTGDVPAVANPNLLNGQGYVNGVSTAPGSILKPTTFQILSFVATGNLQAQFLGSDRNYDGRYWDGDFAEVLLYNSALSGTDRQSVEAYLERKYSLNITVPTGLTWANVATNLPGASSYIDTTVAPNTTYYYRAEAEVPGFADDGQVGTVTTRDLAPDAPGAPTFGAGTGISLPVIAPGPTLPARAYTLKLQRKITAADDSTYIDIDSGIQPGGTSLATGLTTGVAYSFRYVAVGDGGSTPGPAASTPVNLGQGTGLTAQYFNNANLTNLALSRIDPQINFLWNSTPPAPGMTTTYSIRWWGQIQPRFSETYTFDANVNVGLRLWINNQLVIDGWGYNTARSGTIALTAGQKYDFKMEYFTGTGNAAAAQLFWSSPSQVREVVPQQRLFPLAFSGHGNGLRGQYYTGYFANQAFSRIDPQIAFDWGAGAPSAAVSADYFSADWSGEIQPMYSETYTFTLNADDGATLWINGQQITTTSGGTGTGTISLGAGLLYDIRIKYWETTGNASVSLAWSSPSQPLSIIPQSQLYSPQLYVPGPTPGPTPTPPAPYGYARFVSQNVPAAMLPGGTYPVSVTMNNAGTLTWPSSGNYPFLLATVNPQDNTTWGLTRVPLPYDIAPGSNYTFHFNVVAPTVPGTYNMQYQMIEQGATVFGEPTQNLAVKVAGPAPLLVTHTTGSSVTLHTPATIGGGTGFTLQRAPVAAGAVPNIPSAGLTNWYSADSVSSITGGVPIAKWNDLSGQGQKATQAATGQQPLWVPNALNGQSTLRLDGINDYLSFPARTDIRTAFFVAQHRTGTQNYAALLGDSGPENWYGGYGAALFQAPDAGPGVLNGQAYVNGTSAIPAAMTKPTQFQLLSFVTSTAVGADSISKSRAYWDGSYAEILLYNTALSDTDRQSVEEFLARKYNLTLGTPPANLTWTTIATGVSGLTDYVDSSLPADTAYWYRYVMTVPTAILPSGAWTGVPVRGTTRPLPPDAPGAPAGGVATANSVTVTAPGPTLPARSYFLKLQRKLATDLDGAYIDVDDGIWPAGTTVATGLLPQTTYRFRYVAVGPGGITPSTLYADYTTSDSSLLPPDAPAAPTYSNILTTTFTVIMPPLPAHATSMRLEYSTDVNATFTTVPSPPTLPSAVPPATGLPGNALVQITGDGIASVYTFRCVAVGPGGSTIGASSTIYPYGGMPTAPGTPTFTNITASGVTVVAAPYSGSGTLTLQIRLTSQPDTAYSNVAANLAGGSSTPVGNLTKGWSYTFRYVAVNTNGSVPGPGAAVTPTDSLVTWSAGTGIQCQGIRWPYNGVPIVHGQWGKLSSFLATDWDQRDVTTGDGTTSSLFSDSCTYTWTANGGVFENGINQGQSVWWQAPATPGTYVINLVVNDQGGANKANGETGSRADNARPGFNESPVAFSVSIVVQ